MNTLSSVSHRRIISKQAIPSAPHTTASPSMMHEREPKPGDCLDDEREAVGQVVAGAAVEPHPLAGLAGNDPEAVVLDFMQPQLAGRRLWG